METHSGFTFFEIVIVIALVSVIIAFGSISLSQFQSIFRLRSSGDEIRALIQLGREYSQARKDSAIYAVSLSGGNFILWKNSNEFNRYQIPRGISTDPSSVSWTFSPVSGLILDCSPCSLTLSSLGNTEIINITSNGLVY